MEKFVSRKKRRLSQAVEAVKTQPSSPTDDESTDFKLAVLASLHPDLSQECLLDALFSSDGSIETATASLAGSNADLSPRKRPQVAGYQSSLASFAASKELNNGELKSARRALTKKGKTWYLYTPGDVEAHTPCSIIHNFLPPTDAETLLRELMDEVPNYRKASFQLFERTVDSPHSMGFYVDSLKEAQEQKTEYTYNGNYIADVHQTPPEMLRTSHIVRETVNKEIQRRIRDFYPDGKKLKYQSPHDWVPNTSFVNCYDGPQENVGFHSDQLTYLGPRAVIGSLSLGVAREFRVRRIVPPDASQADAQGQISIHLPHNSLLVMHAEMQEEWKHSIAPAKSIDPHPLAGNKRLNITYRCYKASMHPRFTPRCKCNVPCILRCMQKRKETRGQYMWMCDANNAPGQKGCSYFVWAEFDDDGEPPWAKISKESAQDTASGDTS